MPTTPTHYSESQKDNMKRRWWRKIIRCYPFDCAIERSACLDIVERTPPDLITKKLITNRVVGETMKTYLVNIQKLSRMKFKERLQNDWNSGPIKLRMKKRHELRQLVQQHDGTTELDIFLRMRFAAKDTKKTIEQQGRRACS